MSELIFDIKKRATDSIDIIYSTLAKVPPQLNEDAICPPLAGAKPKVSPVTCQCKNFCHVERSDTSGKTDANNSETQ